MKIKEVEVGDYVVKSNLPESDYVINPYVGCPHACMYCYASFMKRFTGHDEEWGTFIDVKRCKKKINLEKLKGKNVFLSSVTDCYNSYESEYFVTRNILEQLVCVQCNLSISTKSNLILRDLDLLKKFKNLVIAVSINTVDDNFRGEMDKASSIKERFETLKILHDNGIYTVLFMSPMFPYITDFKKIIEESHEFVSEYWFENLNLRGDYKWKVLDYINSKHLHLRDKYYDIYVRNNKSYWLDLEVEIDKYCEANNIRYKNYFHHENLVKK
jgi:DNA repair photolyase